MMCSCVCHYSVFLFLLIRSEANMFVWCMRHSNSSKDRNYLLLSSVLVCRVVLSFWAAVYSSVTVILCSYDPYRVQCISWMGYVADLEYDICVIIMFGMSSPSSCVFTFGLLTDRLFLLFQLIMYIQKIDRIYSQTIQFGSLICPFLRAITVCVCCMCMCLALLSAMILFLSSGAKLFWCIGIRNHSSNVFFIFFFNRFYLYCPSIPLKSVPFLCCSPFCEWHCIQLWLSCVVWSI